MKVFLLGLPGCGKSTAARYIKTIAERKGYTVKSFNDYTILREWFEKAPDGPEFSRADNDGFDIHNLTVFDTSLQELERRVLQEGTTTNEIITIEFARNDYTHAFEQFSPEFLQDAYYLFINAENTTCKKRTRKRYLHCTSKDDHFVSDYIFDTYYNKGSYFCISAFHETIKSKEREQSLPISLSRVVIINNPKRNPKENFYLNLKQCIWRITDHPELLPKQPILHHEGTKPSTRRHARTHAFTR